MPNFARNRLLASVCALAGLILLSLILGWNLMHKLDNQCVNPSLMNKKTTDGSHYFGHNIDGLFGPLHNYRFTHCGDLFVESWSAGMTRFQNDFIVFAVRVTPTRQEIIPPDSANVRMTIRRITDDLVLAQTCHLVTIVQLENGEKGQYGFVIANSFYDPANREHAMVFDVGEYSFDAEIAMGDSLKMAARDNRLRIISN
jgi:hypothetical protein